MFEIFETLKAAPVVDFRQSRVIINLCFYLSSPSPGMINKYTVPTESYQTKMEFSNPVGSRSICQLRKYNERERDLCIQ